MARLDVAQVPLIQSTLWYYRVMEGPACAQLVHLSAHAFLQPKHSTLTNCVTLLPGAPSQQGTCTCALLVRFDSKNDFKSLQKQRA
eukprot:132644-Pelagomonas_calceolata.AAC.4